MKLKGSEVKAWREETLALQDGLCAICGQSCYLPRCDHDHQTGKIRGVICNPCNVTLGKIENGRRYGKTFDPVAFANGVGAYLSRDMNYPLHPSHGKPKRKRRKVT